MNPPLIQKQQWLREIGATDYEVEFAFKSYDAIIPLIVKLCNKRGYILFISKLIQETNLPSHQRDVWYVTQMTLRATPTQLADALIRALGKWED